MRISNRYVALTKVEEEAKEGFQAVQMIDGFVYKGRVHALPEAPVYIGNTPLAVGDIVCFAKGSPDTHEVTEDGLTMKLVVTDDILFVK